MNILEHNSVLCMCSNNYHLYYYWYILIVFHDQLHIFKVWPHKEFPLIKVGKIVLNRNPKNYFTDVEQAAFSPAHLVPGIEPSPDKMLQV